jgi:uncharacterized membrane protein YuzA (DUF378 family)
MSPSINILPTLFVDIFILMALFVLGLLIVRAFFRRSDWLALLNLSMGMGAGVLTWVLFIVSWAGIVLNLQSLIVVYSALIVVFLCLSKRSGKKTSHGHSDNDTAERSSILLVNTTRTVWALVITLIISSVLLSWGLSYHSWDGIAIWAVKGYGIASEGSILGAINWGNVGLTFPLNIPLQVAIFRIVGGDVLPGSKLLFPAYFVFLLAGCYRFWLKRRLNILLASLGVLLISSTPLLFTHASIGYTNLPLSFYLISGLLWLIEGLDEEALNKVALGGLLLALAVWTRPEGLVLWIAIVIAVTLGMYVVGRRFSLITYILLPCLIIVVPWFLFMRQHYTPVDEYEASWRAIQGIARGEIHWEALYRILRYLGGQVLRFRDYGFLLAISTLLFCAGFRLKRVRTDLVRTILLFSTVMMGLAVVGILYVFAYPPFGIHEVITRLGSDFNRVFMPPALAFTSLAFIIFSDYIERSWNTNFGSKPG